MTSQAHASEHQLLFPSLSHPGCGIVVPCDAHGQVHMDELSERMKNAYLGARALIGWEYELPIVEPAHTLH